METRKHVRVASGVPGDACVICGDKTVWDETFYMGMADDIRKETLEDRHTVVKTEAHIFQVTVEGGSERCHSCGHGKDYPLHRDFTDYDEMLADFRARRSALETQEVERNRKISKAEWESRQPAKTSGYSHRWWSYFLTFIGGSAVMGAIASLTGW